MVYVEITIEVPRHKVREALEAYGNYAYRWDKEHMEKVGAKTIGCWYTQEGKQGEITFLLAHPTLEDREELLELCKQDAEFSRWMKEVWQSEYAPFATFKVLRAAPFSPLQ